VSDKERIEEIRGWGEYGECRKATDDVYFLLDHIDGLEAKLKLAEENLLLIETHELNWKSGEATNWHRVFELARTALAELRKA
jgi:hypothetical protein